MEVNDAASAATVRRGRWYSWRLRDGACGVVPAAQSIGRRAGDHGGAECAGVARSLIAPMPGKGEMAPRCFASAAIQVSRNGPGRGNSRCSMKICGCMRTIWLVDRRRGSDKDVIVFIGWADG